MALPELRGIARLLSDPRTGIGKTGKPWTSALLKFTQWRKTDDGWEECDGVVASAIAFEDVAGQVADYRKGDDIEVRGPITLEEWNGKPQLKLTVAACRHPIKVAKQAA
jgi:single-stranded DNA-binding protein